MKLEIEFKENWVSTYDILALENIIGVPLDKYFKQKRDFDCYSYQGNLVYNFSIVDIQSLTESYWSIQINNTTLTILNN